MEFERISLTAAELSVYNNERDDYKERLWRELLATVGTGEGIVVRPQKGDAISRLRPRIRGWMQDRLRSYARANGVITARRFQYGLLRTAIVRNGTAVAIWVHPRMVSYLAEAKEAAKEASGECPKKAQESS